MRKKYKSLSQGNLVHFYPSNNVYIYFRETNDESTMIIANNNDNDFEVDLNNYKETLNGISQIENLKSNEEFDITQDKKITIKRKSAEIFLLKKHTN